LWVKKDEEPWTVVFSSINDRLALTDCQEETFHKSKTLDRVLLGLRRLYAGGAKTCSYRVLRVCFFLPPQGGRRQERAGPDRTNGNGD
jgi:hypothetical protein